MNYVNLILLSSTWELSHRKGLYTHLNKKLSEWSEVIFIESPFSLLIHTFIKFRSRVLRKFKKESTDDSIKTFMPIIIFHHKIWNKFKFTLKIDSKLLAFQTKRFLKKKHSLRKKLIWASYPFDYPFIELMEPEFRIYDFYDNFNYDEDGNFNPRKNYFNKLIIEKSDLVFCTAIKLYEFAKIVNANSYYLPNGHNINFSNQEHNLDLKLNGKVIGYLGNIRDWIDFDLVKELAMRLNHDQYLVFIGPVEKSVLKEITLLKKNKQFRHLRAVKYNEIFSYIKNFDIGIIPFKTNNFMNGVFPNKFFEYVASNITIVTTDLPDMSQYKNVINIAKTQEEFISMCWI